jgi:hypothetical protein
VGLVDRRLAGMETRRWHTGERDASADLEKLASRQVHRSVLST